MKRLVIYFHYDPAGCIDTACRIAVQAVQKYGRVVFVTNGTLTPADRVWVSQSGAGRIERENVGFDVGAYREALLTLGREKLAEYEEIVLMNYTLAGPVCSLAAMFTAMDARPELDFWGLTRHYAMQSRRFGGAVPEHLQSHLLRCARGCSTVTISGTTGRKWHCRPATSSLSSATKRGSRRILPPGAMPGIPTCRRTT